MRYSIENPYAYLDSNVIGFMNILEAAKNYKVENLIYASSSSVYVLIIFLKKINAFPPQLVFMLLQRALMNYLRIPIVTPMAFQQLD